MPKLPRTKSIATENIKRGDYIVQNEKLELARIQTVHPTVPPFSTVRYMVAVRNFEKGDTIDWYPQGFTETSHVKFRTPSKRLLKAGKFDA